MDVSFKTELNHLSTRGYKSFGRLCQVTDDATPSGFTFDLNENHDPAKMIPLKDLVSGSPDVLDQNLSNLKETDKDHSSQNSLTPLYAAAIIFAIAIAIALILHFYLGGNLVFGEGVLVSDHERCTALGQKVLNDHGSSVDAAIAAALCLGVVHPHVSGIGGGGVMLVHDIKKNETRVIDFQGKAPKTLTEEMLQNVSELQAGLQVGVPGMLRGLHHAHRLYGRLSWEDVVTRAASVARDGFNVSLSLAEAILKVKGEKLPQHFRDRFFPGGQALTPGSFLKMPMLASILEDGLSNCYDGNFSQEIEYEVQTNGGILSREEICNYTAEVKQPVEGLYHGIIIQTPPPPSAGAALISALSLLDGNNITENQTFHWIDEALKTAMANDPKYNLLVTKLLSDIRSKNDAERFGQNISHSYENYSNATSLQTDLQAGQVVVMGPDNLMVSVVSSLGRLFGSRLITRSGVILNSLIRDTSWPNKTRGQFKNNQRNGFLSERRPLLFVMPTIVVPAWSKCGLYMALSSSGGPEGFKAIIQVLISVLSDHEEKNEMKSHHLPKSLLNESDSLEQAVQLLHQKSPVVQRVKTNSAVQWILRNKDTIQAVSIPQLSDG